MSYKMKKEEVKLIFFKKKMKAFIFWYRDHTNSINIRHCKMVFSIFAKFKIETTRSI